MIYYCMALYPEAAPFIRRLQLKKCEEETHFQIFEKQDVCLIITGVGDMRAVAAVTYLLTKRPPKDSDLLLNVGICAGDETKRGRGYMCNQLLEQHTGKIFYPDMVFRHPFEEAALTTVHEVMTEGVGAAELVDMEATGVYQAGQIFLHPHQMAFVKMVSDAADGSCVTGKQTKSLIEQYTERIIRWSGQVHDMLIKDVPEGFTAAEEEALLFATEEHGLSVTQARKVRQLMRWYKLTGGDMIKLLNDMPERQQRGKEEGRNYLEQLEKRIL